ncbi:MAG: hypothetical protein HRT89_13170 [Lentisphaeria bacterium]|nr:hypothetical protein [Lentisphaeria bacterium]NQZ69008.1 hypothetical protein [Lentisphaeria bacterium]
MVKKKKRFPKRELNTWLKTNLDWSHEIWLGLIDSLRSDGFQDWTDEQNGLDTIGAYLETNRKER